MKTQIDKHMLPVQKHRRAHEARMRIIETAISAFGSHGYEGASIRSIAKEAGTSLARLLYHFRSKRELWQETFNSLRSFGAPYDMAAKYAGPSATATERLASLIRATVELHAKFPATQKLALNESFALSDRVIWLHENGGKANFEQYTEVIRQAQKEGTVRDSDPGKLRFMITAMASTPFAIAAGYKVSTGRNAFSRAEIDSTIQLIYFMVFKDDCPIQAFGKTPPKRKSPRKAR
jgi:TetR/AcrR family transcriptional regulator